MQNKKHLLIGDVFIIGAVLTAALILSLFGLFHKERFEYFSVQIGDHTEIYPTEIDQIYEFSSNGIDLVIESKSGAVSVVKTNCPDKSCMKMGKVKNSGDVIVCLPARVMIKTAGSSDIGGQDALAG